MSATIGLKELRTNLAKYEALVKKGRSFVVMKRAKPVFVIGPVEDREWETVIDFTKFRKGGIDAKELLAILKRI